MGKLNCREVGRSGREPGGRAGTAARKIASCRECDFSRGVQQEEGGRS